VLDQDLFNDLIAAVGDIRASRAALRAVILSSASPRHFMVGAIINVLATFTKETIGDWVRAGHEAFNRLEDLPLPVIARVEGNALGGGLELAMAFRAFTTSRIRPASMARTIAWCSRKLSFMAR
jgi:enoyl-CoA hydratase/carnithine racemase